MAGRGRGGGRGGGAPKGATWEHDATIKLDAKPSALFPEHPDIIQPQSLTECERRQVAQFRSFREGVHRGPLYTHPTKSRGAQVKTFGEEQFNSQYGGQAKAQFDPFQGVETYSQKYDPPRRTLPDIMKIKLDKRFFPEELWSTIEGKNGVDVKRDIGKAMGRRAALVNGIKSANHGAEREKILLEKLDGLEGEEEEDGDEAAAVEEEDYDYEQDEDDLAGDYNAERYFDDGDRMDDDDMDGGGGGEDY